MGMKLVAVENIKEFLEYHRGMVELAGGVFDEKAEIAARREYGLMLEKLMPHELPLIVYDDDGRYQETSICTIKDLQNLLD
jgi:hypothetical protein